MTRRVKVLTLLAAMILAFLTGCSSRVAPHDEKIAAGLAQLQQTSASFFDELQLTAGTPDGTWECHAPWYVQTRAAIDTLRMQADSHGPGNEATSEALGLLRASFDELEQAHAEGLTPGEIPVLRTLLGGQLRMLVQLEAAKKRTAIAEVSP